jgi:hypothetical protein
MEDNDIVENGAYGVGVQECVATLRRNRINRNRNYGVFVDAARPNSEIENNDLRDNA